MKRYLGYWLKQNRLKSIEWMMEHADAPLNHMFNDHSLCDPSWCWIKEKHMKNDHKSCKSYWCRSCEMKDSTSADENGKNTNVNPSAKIDNVQPVVSKARQNSSIPKHYYYW